MCSNPRFAAQAISNGHEWGERQARQKRGMTIKDGNCFMEASDFAGISRLAAELKASRRHWMSA